VRDPVVMNHPAIAGQEDKIVERSAYRGVWYGRGWRSTDDPSYVGGDAAPPATLEQRVGRRPSLRAAETADWPEVVFSVDAVNSPATTISFEHGQVVARGSGAGTGARSNRRSMLMIPGSPGGYSRIRSRWSGANAASGLMPQRGHMHGVGVQADGMRRGVIVWHDIVFSQPQLFNVGVWETSPADPSQFAVLTGALRDEVAVSAAARTSNVVTLTVAAGHGLVAGDVITVNLSDNTFDGTFVVSSAGATTVLYPQTGVDDASGGTGTAILPRAAAAKNGLLRTVAASDAVRSNGGVVATVTAGHSFQPGDQITADFADNTYDGGQFVVTAVTDTTVTWRQAAADDPSAGAGTITRAFPYWVESEWSEGLLRARMWPDFGSGPSGNGAMPSGPPPWESMWSIASDLSGLGTDEPDPSFGEGCGLLAGHLASGPVITEVRYDNVEVAAL